MPRAGFEIRNLRIRFQKRNRLTAVIVIGFKYYMNTSGKGLLKFNGDLHFLLHPLPSFFVFFVSFVLLPPLALLLNAA
jgi:hypothetical protein